MNIDLIVTGQTNIPYVAEGMETSLKRLRNYINFTVTVLPDIRNAKSITSGQLKEREGEQLLKALERHDHIVFLDEGGAGYSSVEFSEWLNKRAVSGIKRLCFVVGGAYGFSSEAYKAANEKLSISKMTFSHQMIRLLFVEQLYRAFTILGNEPYHHR